MKSAWGLSRYYSGNGNLFIGERWKRKLWDFVEMLEIEDLISACGNDDDDDVLLDYFEREREKPDPEGKMKTTTCVVAPSPQK